MSGYEGRGSGRRGDNRGGGGYRGGRGDRGGGSFRGGDRGRGGDRERGGGRGGAPVRVFRDPTTPPGPPDSAAMSIENKYMENQSGIGALSLKDTTQSPPRPGYGNLGKRAIVYTNYFKIHAENDLQITRYHVEVTPEATGKKLARIFQLLRELPEFSRVATEFKSFIVAREPLKISDGHEVDIVYRGDGEDTPLPKAVTYKLRIINPTALSVGDLVHYLCATTTLPEFSSKPEVIQGLNALFGHSAQVNRQVISTGTQRHFSIDRNPANLKILGGGLESLRGYYQSIRPATGGLLLNVNVTHGVFLEPIRLDGLLEKLGTRNIKTLQEKLKGVRVRVLHLPPKLSKMGQFPRVKTIYSLAIPSDGRQDAHPPQVPTMGATADQVKFWYESPASTATKPGAKAPAKHSGSSILQTGYISVYEYFRKRYPQLTLNGDTKVVNVGNNARPVYLPAEVCEVLPGQIIKRRLSPDQTQQMITFACRKPWENGDSIVADGKATLGLNPTSLSPIGYFGLRVGANLITVAARVLPPPQIKYKSTQNTEKSLNVNGGQWNMANTKFYTGSNIGRWTYILFQSNTTRNFDPAIIRQTVAKFQNHLEVAGINTSGFIKNRAPAIVQLQTGNDRTNDDTIRDILGRMGRAAEKPRFVLCILPVADTAVYNSIKTAGDTRDGIHTVCVVASKFLKDQRQDQYFGNVALKFNLKAGGNNQIIDSARLGIVGEGKTMVVGIDVTHPSPGSKDTAPSAAAVVASVDRFLAQWPATFNIQEGRKETVSALEDMFLSRLEVWEKKNRSLPENVIVYRDGVSEGQYQLLLTGELPLIRKACQRKYPATATKQGLPNISIIVCGKRHHTRFYPTAEAEADRSSNCNPGTVVDRGVTEVRNWDFFLQPHACLQGTARSCHYYVVLDEVFRKQKPKAPHRNHADALEELTHNMCHLFGRATKAVSLCPPAYYADLLCTRLRCYLSDQYDPAESSATASVISGSGPSAPPSAPSIGTFNSTVKIHNALKDSMFYI